MEGDSITCLPDKDDVNPGVILSEMMRKHHHVVVQPVFWHFFEGFANVFFSRYVRERFVLFLHNRLSHLNQLYSTRTTTQTVYLNTFLFPNLSTLTDDLVCKH